MTDRDMGSCPRVSQTRLWPNWAIAPLPLKNAARSVSHSFIRNAFQLSAHLSPIVCRQSDYQQTSLAPKVTKALWPVVFPRNGLVSFFFRLCPLGRQPRTRRHWPTRQRRTSKPLPPRQGTAGSMTRNGQPSLCYSRQRFRQRKANDEFAGHRLDCLFAH